MLFTRQKTANPVPIETRKKYATMEQDVYEHLARTFLDKKKKRRFPAAFSRSYLIVIIVVIFVILISIFFSNRDSFPTSLAILGDKAPLVMGYDFTIPAISKIKKISFDLDATDLGRYSLLAVTIRTREKTRIDSTIAVELENSFLEKDVAYLSGINSGWKTISIPLDNYKHIHNWNAMKRLSFVVDEWNIENKKGSLIIDEVSFCE